VRCAWNGVADRARVRRRYTDNAEAYDLYLRGRASFVNYTENSMKAAIGDFERALAIDPDYALARAGLAIASAWFSIRYAYETEASEWGARAERDAKAALAADPSLAEQRCDGERGRHASRRLQLGRRDCGGHACAGDRSHAGAGVLCGCAPSTTWACSIA
jgi:hypothetical protein